LVPRFEMTYLLYPLVIYVALFAALFAAASYAL
jgi:hypothetical protein